jgi:uncharacterized membrane protein
MVGYGTGPLLAKKLTDRVSPLHGVFLTNLAVVATAFVAAATERPFKAPGLSAWGILVLGGMTGALAIFSFFKGIEAGQVAVVAPVANSFPIVTWGLTLIFLDSPFSAASFLCTLVVVAGVIVLAYQRQAGFQINRSALFGVVTAMGWGAHAFFIYLLLDSGLLPFSTGFYLEGAILVWLAVFLIVRRDFKLNLRHLWPFGLSCGIVTALGALMYTLAVSSEGDPELVATIVGANPILTCLLALVLFKEKLSRQQTMGIGITIAGLVALRVVSLL